MKKAVKTQKRIRRQNRTRGKIIGTQTKPRLSVFRSNRHVTAQLINDEENKSLLQINDLKLEKKNKLKKTEIAFNLGKFLAESAKKKGIERVVFDRGGYKYHGRVKAVAEGAREGGLQF